MVDADFYELLSSPFLLLLILAGLFQATIWLRARLGGSPWINPTLFTTFGMIGYLLLSNTPYEKFEYASGFLTFWLQVAVVCLAVPLYLQWERIKKQWLAIIVSQAVGCITAIVTGVWLVQWFGGSEQAVLSMVAKSVTTPIAIEVTQNVGGVVGINASTVLIAGVVGQIIGLWFFRVVGVKSHIGKGLAMGTGSHALGIAALMPFSQRYVAYGTVGLIVNGVMTAFVAPVIVPWLV